MLPFTNLDEANNDTLLRRMFHKLAQIDLGGSYWRLQATACAFYSKADDVWKMDTRYGSDLITLLRHNVATLLWHYATSRALKAGALWQLVVFGCDLKRFWQFMLWSNEGNDADNN